MKIKFLFLLSISIFGISQIPNSFSNDYFSLPSCYDGVFASDHVQCSTGNSSPCSEPSFEKNGFCVVKKIDICETDSILKDGLCIERNNFFKVDDSTFTRQSLQTGETLSGSGALTSLIIGSFGPILIVFFIILYAIKKRSKQKKDET